MVYEVLVYMLVMQVYISQSRGVKHVRERERAKKAYYLVRCMMSIDACYVKSQRHA
jgi:hypothetical protein